MRYDAIIFDLDGTLGNTLPLCIAAFRAAIEPLIGRSVSDAEIIATFGPSEEGTIKTLAPDHFDVGLASYLSCYESLHDACPEPFEGVHALLERLHAVGVRVGLVTGKGRKSADMTLKRFGLTFADIEAGSPDGPRKVEGIRDMVAKWGIAPDRVLYVGDAVSDVHSAREAGVGVVGAAWAETADPQALAAAGPDALFESLDAFSRWVFEQGQLADGNR